MLYAISAFPLFFPNKKKSICGQLESEFSGGNTPHRFTATYHKEYGYPMQVAVDKHEMMADEEYAWDILCLSFTRGELRLDDGDSCDLRCGKGCYRPKEEIWCRENGVGRLKNVCKGPKFSGTNPNPNRWTLGACSKCVEV